MIEAYPLYWPEGWKRTPPGKRKYNAAFKKAFGENRDHLMAEVDRLGGSSVVLSTNIPLRRDGLPYADKRSPDDPGVAIYFNYKNKPMCFACDGYYSARENIRATSLTIEALRGIERWGASDMMERAFRGFTALPDLTTKHWTKVLGFNREIRVTKEAIEHAYRRLVRIHHPDKDGDPEKFREITAARDAAFQCYGIGG